MRGGGARIIRWWKNEQKDGWVELGPQKKKIWTGVIQWVDPILIETIHVVAFLF